MDITVEFGKTIKKLRLSHGLSQGKLAKKLRVNPTYISQIERGVSNLSLKKVYILAQALNVKVKELF